MPAPAIYGPVITRVDSEHGLVWARWYKHGYHVDVCWSLWHEERWRNSTMVWYKQDLGVVPGAARDVALMLTAAADAADGATGATPEDLAQDLRDRFGATDVTDEQRERWNSVEGG
jgi:hypothetical protein